MKPKVYVESSVISYLTSRPSRDLITAANQEITQVWWNHHRHDFDLYVSQLVLLEVGAGDPEAAQSRIVLAGRAARKLDLSRECSLLGRKLLRESGLPKKANRDALHMAIAAVHQMDFLLTWNCRHIANAVLFSRFSSIMSSWGYTSPVLCTPPQLLEHL
jgi:hypothetical protein